MRVRDSFERIVLSFRRTANSKTAEFRFSDGTELDAESKQIVATALGVSGGGGGGVVADGSITTPKLADASVTAAKVAADVATQTELDAGLATKLNITTANATYGRLVGPNAWTGTQDFTGATVTGLAGGDGAATDPLARWRRKLATSPSTAKIVFVGDSTTDELGSAGYMMYRLRSRHTMNGEALSGMPSDWFSDGVVTSGSPIVTSATANFSQADVGRAFVPGNVTQVPFVTTVLSVQSATQATLSNNALATATGVRFQVGRSIRALGYSGLNLGPVGQGWLADAAKQAALVAENPDLVILSFLLNDVRLGQCDLPSAIARLDAFVAWAKTNIPNADILLRMPNPMLTANVSNFNYVRDAPGGNINPAGLAQAYTNIMRQAYLAMVGKYSNVAVFDTMAEIFGTRARASHPLLADQLHPSSGYTGGGYVVIADAIAGRIGTEGGGGWTANPTAYRTSKTFRCNGGGVNFIDLVAEDGDDPAAQFPLDATFSLLVDGYDGLIPLSSASFSRPFSVTNIRVTGLSTGGTDFGLAFIGRKVLAVSTSTRHPATKDRQIVSVDLPSIAAGATVSVTATVTGLAGGNRHQAAGVVAAPPEAFTSGGLLLLGAYPGAAVDTVVLVVNNPTGAPVDLAAANWAFWVVR